MIMAKHSSLHVAVDGQLVSGRASESALLMKIFALLAERVTFVGHDGLPVPDDLVGLDLDLLFLQNRAAGSETLRGVIAQVASAALPVVAPSAPEKPSPGERARQVAQDLAREEQLAADALRAVRERRERAAHLILEGDVSGAAELSKR